MGKQTRLYPDHPGSTLSRVLLGERLCGASAVLHGLSRAGDGDRARGFSSGRMRGSTGGRDGLDRLHPALVEPLVTDVLRDHRGNPGEGIAMSLSPGGVQRGLHGGQFPLDRHGSSRVPRLSQHTSRKAAVCVVLVLHTRQKAREVAQTGGYEGNGAGFIWAKLSRPPHCLVSAGCCSRSSRSGGAGRSGCSEAIERVNPYRPDINNNNTTNNTNTSAKNTTTTNSKIDISLISISRIGRSPGEERATEIPDDPSPRISVPPYVRRWEALGGGCAGSVACESPIDHHPASPFPECSAPFSPPQLQDSRCRPAPAEFESPDPLIASVAIYKARRSANLFTRRKASPALGVELY